MSENATFRMESDMVADRTKLRLRGHHLICLHFFRGEGYSEDFIVNLRDILRRAEAGEQIAVTSEADDVCEICPYLKEKKCSYNEDSDQEIQAMDRKALELLELRVQDIVFWLDIRGTIPALFQRWSREFCRTCDWKHACERDTFFRQLS
jgi:uncharacterized protein